MILKDCSMDEFSNILSLLTLKMYAQSTHVNNNIFFSVYSRCISGKEKFYLSDGLNFMVTLCINDIKHFIVQLMHTALQNVVIKTF